MTTGIRVASKCSEQAKFGLWKINALLIAAVFATIVVVVAFCSLRDLRRRHGRDTLLAGCLPRGRPFTKISANWATRLRILGRHEADVA